MERVQVMLRIKGRVQGVFFRHSAKLEARRLGLTGWIRNCEDGDVEAVAEGPRERVGDFIAWCRMGPPHAQVDHIEVEESAATGQFSAFRVEHM
jgi:acylphosphatase